MPTITALPTPPSRSDPTNFAAQGDAFLSALPTFQAEANAVAAALGVADTSQHAFVPTIGGTGGNPSVGYTAQDGVYQKVGQTVKFSMKVFWNSMSGGSGNVLIGGLPYPAANTNSGNNVACPAIPDGITFPVGTTMLGAIVLQNTQTMNVYCSGSGVAINLLPVSGLGAAGGFFISGSYLTP
jgi:hypothetical protein